MAWVGRQSPQLDGAYILFAASLSLVCLIAFVLVAIIWPSEDVSPVPFSVEVPPQLRKGYKWDLTGSNDEPEIRDDRIQPRCPADGRPLAYDSIKAASPTDIDHAIASAATAQREWTKTTFAQRRKLLNTLLQYVIDQQEDIVEACCLDSGKTKIDASFGEVVVTVEKLQWTIKHGENALAPSYRPTNLLMCYKSNYVVYEPLGVVAACFSWNYPFHSWISNVISALFSGNAIILKPSEQTCWSSTYFLDIVRSALTVCGHSPEIVQNIICLPDVADHLTSHPGISHITFIGSRPVAHKVCTSAAKALTPVTVELGGKDPAIVLDDHSTIADIDSVVSIIMRGTFQSAGQNCIGIERVIALPAIHDILVAKLESQIRNLRLGSVTHPSTTTSIDLGSMISSASFSRLESLITDAISRGARLHTGGTRYIHPDHPQGHYFLPTLLSNITSTMPIAQTELFAPICLVLRATDPTHATALANSTSYGLGASIFGVPTRQNTPIIRAMSRDIKAGMVSINDFGSFYACSLPFGGTKGSGYGRFSGAEGLQGLCNIKSICEDSWWARLLGIKTAIPPVLQYPVHGSRGWTACKGIVGTGYSPTWSGRLKALGSLLGALTGFSGGKDTPSERVIRDEGKHVNGQAKN